MARYIDADKLLENLKKQYGEDLGWQCPVNMSDVGMMIEDAPTADVEEVVRCCDCGMSRETEDEMYLFCMEFADTVDCQAFCSYGERKEDKK